MKKVFIISALFIFALTNEVANAAGNVGQCVYPKTKPAKKGPLEFKSPIFIYKTPNSTDYEVLKEFSSFSVKAESNGLIQLITVPDYDLPEPSKVAGKVVGWAKLSDFKIIELRNRT